jgi:hypothetical protein
VTRARLAVALTALVLAAPASAATVASDVTANWGGYVVTPAADPVTGLPGTFSTISGTWVQPTADCASAPAGTSTASAFWVGLGGNSETSNALEQIGTEVDCSTRGRQLMSAWYELVPAPSHPIRSMKLHAGDVMAASVVLGAGNAVTLTLADETTKAVFHRTFTASAIDDSSAEWILEAPSECIGPNACQTLPLANFSSATFALAQATESTGHTGPISDPAWSDTEITLAPHGRRYVGYRQHSSFAGGAVPGPLDATGSAFTVAFKRVAAETNPFLSVDRLAHGLLSF